MRTLASIISLFFITLALSGCGGDSGCGHVTGAGGAGGTSTCGTGNTPPPGQTLSTLKVSSSLASIPGDGSASASITATAADASGNPVAGVSVTFTATAGTLVTNQATTDAAGKATATLTAGSAAPGASITVTATSGTISGNTAVTVAVAKQTVSLQTSSPTIPSDNTTPATITAYVKDANNNLVPGVVVHFQATSGSLAVSTPTGGSPGMTDATGAATATLSVGTDPSVRTVTVTATANGSSASIDVQVAGTTVGVAGPTGLVLGASGTYTVSLNDAGKKAIPNQAVQVTSSAGNTLSASSVTTDSSGHATFTMKAVNSGSDTVSVSALGASSAETVTVSNQQFVVTAPTAGSLVPIAAAPCTPNVPVIVNWKASNAPIAVGTTVNFASTRGTLSAPTATTDSNGNAQVMICATSAGPATVSATATIPSTTNSVSASVDFSFISTTPTSVDLQASPSTVPITGQSTLTAVVRDAAGNLVQNQTVDFTLQDVTGGSISLASGVTDVQGIAQTVYTASRTASASNGVSVTATVHNTAITKTAMLTVSGAALHVIIGTGNKLVENVTKTAYTMNWFVSVSDAAGNAVPNSQVTLTIHSSLAPFAGYFKGAYCKSATSWVPTNQVFPGFSCPAAPATTPASTVCANEDVNLNGQLDAGEDLNSDGILEPGDIAVAAPGLLTTAADGTNTFQVIYPEDHANWVEVTLTARATVQGTEGSTSSTFVLPALASYLNDLTTAPPGIVSPYGSQACNQKN
jgi:Big-like domain-containing protein